MPNTFHDAYIGHNNHAITANPTDSFYANLAAMNADTAFSTLSTNLNKIVGVTSPLSLYWLSASGSFTRLVTVGDLAWEELSNTPSSISAGLVVQGNAAGTALEFGQALKVASSPTFVGLTLTGDLNIAGDLNFTGTAQVVTKTIVKVVDHNMELGAVATPTDITADGGGITLKGATDKTIAWTNSTDLWTFNQGIDLGTTNKLIVNDIKSSAGTDLDITGFANLTINAVTLEIDSSGSGGITIAAGGTGVIEIDPGSGVLTVDGVIKSNNGTELLPAYSFKLDPATGMRLSATNILNFSARGFDVLQLTAPVSAVNFVTMTAGQFDDTTGVKLSVDGSQADINFDISSKGANTLRLNVTSGSGPVSIGTGDIIEVGTLGTVAMGLGITTAPPNTNGTVLELRAGSPNTQSRIIIASAANDNKIDIGIKDTANDSGAAFIHNTSTTIMRLLTSTGEALTLTGLDVIAKASLQVVGNFIVDTNTFFVDATNNRIATGTTSPLGLAHFKSGGTASSTTSFANELTLESSGDVGATLISGDNQNAHIVFRNQSDSTSAIIRYRANGEIFTIDVGSIAGALTLMGSGSASLMANALVIDTNKNSGFGTPTPLAKVNILKTTEQLRLSYDISNFTSFTVNSSGDLSVKPSGNQTIFQNERVGFGTILPDVKVHVDGAVYSESFQSPFGGSGRLQNYLANTERLAVTWTTPFSATVASNVTVRPLLIRLIGAPLPVPSAFVKVAWEPR